MTPWGDAINYDGPNVLPVRQFVVENAEYWIGEFHLDGLRLDAVHAIKDDSRPDILDEIAERVRMRFDRSVHLLIENEENEPERLRRKRRRRRWLHRAVERRRSSCASCRGDRRDERLLRRLWRDRICSAAPWPRGSPFRAKSSPYRGRRGAARAARLPPLAFVAFIQNHDQIGNRAFGERLSVLRRPGSCGRWRASISSCRRSRCCSWARSGARASRSCSSAISSGDLAKPSATGGARSSPAFPNSPTRQRSPRFPTRSPKSTFLASKLAWSKVDLDHLDFYRAALAARRRHVRPLLPAIGHGGRSTVVGDQAVRVSWTAGAVGLVLDANLSPTRSAAFPVSGWPRLLALWRGGRGGRARPVERALEPRGPMIPPRATYRLQLRKELRLRDAARSRPISRASASAMSICRPSSRRGPAARTATTSPTTASSIPSSGRRPTTRR